MSEYEKDPMRSILLGLINETEAIRAETQAIRDESRALRENVGKIEQQNEYLRKLVLVSRNEWQETKRWMRAPFWKRWFGTV